MSIELIDAQTKTINAPATKLMLAAVLRSRYFDSGATLRGHSEHVVEMKVYGMFAMLDDSDSNNINVLVESFAEHVESKAATLGLVIYETDKLSKNLEPREMLNNFNHVLSEVVKDLCSDFKVINWKSDAENSVVIGAKPNTIKNIILFDFDEHHFMSLITTNHLSVECPNVPERYKDRILLGYDGDQRIFDNTNAALRVIYKLIDPYVIQALGFMCNHQEALVKNDYK